MRKLIIIAVLALLAWGCKKQPSVTVEEGFYTFTGTDGKSCGFATIADYGKFYMDCTPEQVAFLEEESLTYISYTKQNDHKVLTSAAPLSRVQTQARWQGENCDFYFIMEDWWRDMDCTDDQKDELERLGQIPLIIVYYEDTTQKDKFYLWSVEPYSSEFTETMFYQWDSREKLCGFYNVDQDEDLVMNCTPEQRLYIEENYENTPLLITYTDAGGYTLLYFEADEGYRIPYDYYYDYDGDDWEGDDWGEDYDEDYDVDWEEEEAVG